MTMLMGREPRPRGLSSVLSAGPMNAQDLLGGVIVLLLGIYLLFHRPHRGLHVGRTSLAEIFQGLAVMVESVEEDGVAGGLRSVLADPGSGAALSRDFEAARGRFSWQRAAADLAGLLSALENGMQS